MLAILCRTVKTILAGKGKPPRLLLQLLLLGFVMVVLQYVVWVNDRCFTPSVTKEGGWMSTKRGGDGLVLVQRDGTVPGKDAESDIPLRIVEHGENIKVGDSTEVHIMSAVNRGDYPVPDAFNVVFVAWADNRFRYVAYAEKSCQVNMTVFAHEIAAPPGNVSDGFAVCLKVAYGELSPNNLVEWFEFAKLVGVTTVHVYYHIVNEAAMTVFRFYEQRGFVQLSPVTPAALKGHPPRGFKRPRWERQAWMDGAVACNDCLHRLHGYPFVAVMDLDELLFPSPPFSSLVEVMEAAVKQHPTASYFTIDSYVVLLDWPAVDNVTSVSFLRHQDHTVNAKLDNFGYGKSSPKVIYRPQRTLAVASHDAVTKDDYTSHPLPKSSYKFLHYRSCKKSLWGSCPTERIRDRDLLRFKSHWIQAISKLPLSKLKCSKSYVHAVAKEAKQIASGHI